jgi:hypothetical protein
VKILKYPNVLTNRTQSEIEHRIGQLAVFARALANGIETLQAELSSQRKQPKQIDFYEGVERYVASL